jgi:hypothetical protein
MKTIASIIFALGITCGLIAQPKPDCECDDTHACPGTLQCFKCRCWVGGVAWSQSGPNLTIRNASHFTLLGLHLIGSSGVGYTFDGSIDPGSSQRSRIAGNWAPNYKLDGAVFSDGHIEGPNSWGIERYLAMRDAIERGGPAEPDSMEMDKSGSSYAIAASLARRFEKRHGYSPMVKPPPPPPGGGGRGGLPPGNVPQITGWSTVGDNNGDVQFDGAICAITNFFPIDVIGCYGTGACAPQPNTYVPGKAVVFAGVELYGDCSIGVGYVAAEEVNSPPPGSGWSIYYVGYADAFNSNNPATAWVIDSCIAAQQTFDSGLAPCP